MDPNANLQKQRDLAKVIFEAPEGFDTSHVAERLAELVEALDGWLSRGGFLPKDWSRNR